MKKIILAIVCVLALSSCNSSDWDKRILVEDLDQYEGAVMRGDTERAEWLRSEIDEIWYSLYGEDISELPQGAIFELTLPTSD